MDFLGVLRRIFRLLTTVSRIVPFSGPKIYFPEISFPLFRILTPYAAALLSLTNLRRLRFTEYIKTCRSTVVRWPSFFLFNTKRITYSLTLAKITLKNIRVLLDSMLV